MIEMDQYPHQQPATRFSWWDVAGVAAYTGGTVLNVIDDGLRMLSRVFFAAAEDSRARRDERDAEWAQERERQILAKALDDGTITFSPEDLA